MKVRNIMLALLLVGVICFMASGGWAQQAQGKEFPRQVRFLSASVGTENFGIQALWMGKVQAQMKIPAGAFPGGPEFNLPVLSRGEAEFSYSNPQYTQDAMQGTKPFERALPNLRWIGAFGYTGCVFMTRNDSKIKTITDINGKRISVGAKGSGPEQMSLRVLEAAGLTPETIQKAGGVAANMSHAQAADAMLDGSIDVVCVNAGSIAINAVFTLVNERYGLRLVEIPEDIIQKCVAKYPTYMKVAVKGGVYKGSPNTTYLVGDAWGGVTRAELSDDFIYQFMKVIYDEKVAKESREKFQMYYQFGDTEVGVTFSKELPMHPGAAKFWTERGVDLKARGIQVKP